MVEQPGSLTCELESTTVSPIVMLKSLYKYCLCFDVNAMSSVLSSFRFNIFKVIHCLISETHNWIRASPSRQSLMIHCHIQLCVICIRMVRQYMPLNDVTNRLGVHAMNFRTQNRNLRDSKPKLLIYGYRVFNNCKLYPTGEIRLEPIKCITNDK